MFEQRLCEFWDVKYKELDEYGFMRADEYTDEEYNTFASNYLTVLDIRSKKWTELLQHQNQVKKSGKLKRYIRLGIPISYRKSVWLAISGAENLKDKESYNFYINLLQEERNAAIEDTIRLDVHRTYPENYFFQGSHYIHDELANVLIAYAQHNPKVGYCQGLNYIAGMLLLATKNQEATFWLLKVLVEDILKDYYSSTMEGVIVDIEVLSELIRRTVPDVHEHISNLGLPWAVVTTKWFVCLYADVLPSETVFRIWDCLFSEGSKILFRVGITLIKKNRTQLLACEDVTEAAECFKTMTRNNVALNCHEFLESIFQEPGKLSNSTIRKLRRKIRKEMSSKKKEAENKAKASEEEKRMSSRTN